MGRIKLAASCVLLILASLPLLPGLGVLVIAETVVVLERHFPSLTRLFDRLQRRSPAAYPDFNPYRGNARPPQSAAALRLRR